MNRSETLRVVSSLALLWVLASGRSDAFDKTIATEQQESAEALGVDVVQANSIGMELVLIPAGEFVMGSPDDEESRIHNEGPQHTVRISRPFYMGAYEVTQAEWEAVTGTNPSEFSSTGRESRRVAGMNTARFPVEHVSWFDAVWFCNELSQQEQLPPYYSLSGIRRTRGRIDEAEVSIIGGSGYRLPTEAEWEYACRAGTTTPFHFGSGCNGRNANFNGNEPYGTTETGPSLQRTTDVGSYDPNAFGLYDMHGNNWEWCYDWHDAAAYSGRGVVTVDPVVTTPPRGPDSFRVLRGGSWYVDAKYGRSARRDGGLRNQQNSNNGFRVARTP